MYKLFFMLCFLLPISHFSLLTSSFAATWEKTFGGTGQDEGWSVEQTTDGGFIIAGMTSSFGAGESDVYLIKLDSLGNEVWMKTFGGDSADEGRCVKQTQDSGFIITGYTKSYGAGDKDIWLIKTKSSGDTSWTKTFGSNKPDEGWSVEQTTDGGFIVAGATHSWGAKESDVVLIKTNSLGNDVWGEIFGGADDDEGRCVRQTADSGFIVVGYTKSYGSGDKNVWLIKTKSSGDTSWTRIFGGGNPDEGMSVEQTTDGGFIVAGYTESYGASDRNIWLIKTDNSGNPDWDETLGGEAPDEGMSVEQIADGGFIVAGATHSWGAKESDVVLIKTNSLGNDVWGEIFGGVDDDEGRCVRQTADGGFIIVGYTKSCGAGSSGVYVIKTDSLGNVGVEEAISQLPTYYSLSQNSPNPFNKTTVISFQCPVTSGKERTTLKIYNLSGRLIKTLFDKTLTTNHLPLTTTVSWDGRNESGKLVANGVYFYKLNSTNFASTRKLIVLK
ncbi:T9SS type A sorting domain-containing protein [candidate division WOR-3 bacterium]|nr:T9SS type A sorting domain-containing protein [candidate division WOR-3 bacterium]